MYKLITSIDGIGMFTAVEVIISTNEFKNFDNAKKFACYCGVVPFDYSSGTSVFKKARVSPMANINTKKNIIYTNFDNWFFYVIFGLYYISFYGTCENFGY